MKRPDVPLEARPLSVGVSQHPCNGLVERVTCCWMKAGFYIFTSERLRERKYAAALEKMLRRP